MIKENPFNIQIKDISMGRDIAFVITGGVAHIGAVAIAYLQDGQVEVNTVELPHHKEGELAKECAIQATTALKCTTTVSIGIHIDNANKEDIESIIKFVRNEMTNKIKSIKELNSM